MPLVPRRLDRSRPCNAGRNLGRPLGRRRQHEIGGADGGDIDVQIDAIQQPVPPSSYNR
jgi:hypothetical protein